MRQLCFIAILFGLLHSVWADDDDHERAQYLRAQGQILPLTQILDKAQQFGLEVILEVELEREDGRWIYELKALNAQRQVQEILLDAQSGELLAQENDDDEDEKKHQREYDAEDEDEDDD